VANEHNHSRTVRHWCIGVLFAVIISAGLWFWLVRFVTYHYAVVIPGALYRDGNRSIREFATACRKARPKTVVMLNDDYEILTEPFKSEIEFCQRSGIKLIRIPVTLGQRPTSVNVQRFLEIAVNPEHQPVLVHCAQGVRRTAMMVAAYQESILGWDDARTKSAIIPFGRKPTSNTLEDIRRFIDDYDGQSRIVKAQSNPISAANE
jgi:protein tyrosine phosphatase (PTP) superfamily phosphohydrolase (DUF442 family)